MFESRLDSLPLIARGKVRDNYAVGADRLLMVASDRLSAFDVVMGEPFPGKGEVLTRMALFWFERLGHVVPNHLTGDDPESVVADAERAQVRGRSMLVKRLAPLPIEAVVRGYLAGSGWKEYTASGAVCGVPLPPGLKNASRLPAPIFTPATKAAQGEHDENIDFERAAEMIGADLAARVRDVSIRLYTEAAAFALTKGIVIADTKFEFGLDAAGTLTLMDEILTPDSSRFWPAASYAVGGNPPSYDKQFVRDWLERVQVNGKPWNKRAPAPALPADVIAKTGDRYRAALAAITAQAPRQPQSRILARLQALIDAEVDPVKADCLRAGYVGQLARASRVVEAQALLTNLRKRYERAAHPVVTPWLNFGDALIDRELEHIDSAIMKMRRAHALAASGGLLPLQALAAGYLSHLYWNELQVEAAVAHAHECLLTSTDKDIDARCRVSLVVGEILARCGGEKASEPWFARARGYAFAAGDDVAKNALAFNLASVRIAVWRQSVLARQADTTQSALASLHFENSRNVHQVLGIPLDELSTEMLTDLLSLSGKAHEALMVHETKLRKAKSFAVQRRQSFWLADEAWCHARLGASDRARAVALESEACLTPKAHVDDRAAMHSRLALVYQALGDMSSKKRHADQANEAWTKVEVLHARCLTLCEGLGERG